MAIPFASVACEELFGLDPQILREDATPWIILVHPDDQASLQESIGISARTMEPWIWQGRVRLLTGAEKWIQGVSRPELQADGVIVWDGMMMDITAHKQAEEALKRRDAILRTVNLVAERLLTTTCWEEGMNDVLAYLGHVTRVSRVYIFQNEQTAPELMLTNQRYEWTATGITPQIDNPQLQQCSLEQAGFVGWEEKLQRNHIITGHIHQFSPAVLGATIHRQQAEQALRESEVRYRSIFENATLGMFRTTLEGRLLVANPALAHMLGYASAAELYAAVSDVSVLYVQPAQRTQIVRRIVEHQGRASVEVDLYRRDGSEIIVNLEEHERASANMQRLVSGVAVGFEEYRVQSCDGSLFDMEVNGKLLHDATGVARGIVFVCRDVTERKRMTQELAAKSADLEQALRQSYTLAKAADAANRAKSVFLTNMSHELRTPLNAILGFAQLMSRDPDLTHEQQGNLEIILDSGEHLLNLINDVLDLSKIEAGRITFQPQNFDLYRLLETLEEMFRLRAVENGLTLRVECSSAVPQYVQTDQGKLRQVLQNLLGNAIKFTQAGHVVLRVAPGRAPAQGDVPASLLTVETTSMQEIYFEVEDTGPGIPVTDLDSVFDPFIQASNGDEPQEGTGLGLPISRQFVRLMGGDLTLRSTPGIASSFRFQIPVTIVAATDVPAEEAQRRAVGLLPNQPVYRLLVVEDRDANRRLLVKLLITLGFEVREAVNGAEAVALWQAWQPHLIWMDMRMPVMDGYEAIRQIKSTIQGQATVIIALTASAFEEERALILSQGCDNFLRKPFREAEIVDALIRHLGVRFVYADQPVYVASQSEVASHQEAIISALVSIPITMRTALRHATITADLEQLLALIADVRVYNAALAEQLEMLAHHFEHDTILQCIKQATQEYDE